MSLGLNYPGGASGSRGTLGLKYPNEAFGSLGTYGQPYAMPSVDFGYQTGTNFNELVPTNFLDRINTAAATGPADIWSLNGFMGTKDAPGWGGMALGTAQGLGNLFMGMQQYGLAKKTLAENKRQFQLNYDAQRSSTNTALEDRQRARVASNPGAYQSVSSYMEQNGIK